MQKLLTITVPVYNVEQYIRQCLDSFLVADISNDLEILVIDDGTKDQSAFIAADYEVKYPNIFHVIHKENGGHGSAVNKGIENASGKYFKVVDGDDWVDPVSLKKLVLFLKKTDSDMIINNFCSVIDGTSKKREQLAAFPNVHYGKEYNFSDICKDLYIKMHAITIRTDILQKNHIFLDEHCYYVDMEYITYPIPYVNTITFLKDYVYQYRVGLEAQSVNIRSMQKNVSHHLMVTCALITFCQNMNEEWGNNSIESSKKVYVMHIVQRMIASQFKIYLSFDPCSQMKDKLLAFDSYIHEVDQILYSSQTNYVVRLLRISRFRLYRPISYIVRYLYLR